MIYIFVFLYWKTVSFIRELLSYTHTQFEDIQPTNNNKHKSDI